MTLIEKKEFRHCFVCLQEICLRESEVVLCGGSESMSQAPYAARNIRFGTKFGFDLKVCF